MKHVIKLFEKAKQKDRTLNLINKMAFIFQFLSRDIVCFKMFFFPSEIKYNYGRNFVIPPSDFLYLGSDRSLPTKPLIFHIMNIKLVLLECFAINTI